MYPTGSGSLAATGGLGGGISRFVAAHAPDLLLLLWVLARAVKGETTLLFWPPPLLVPASMVLTLALTPSGHGSTAWHFSLPHRRVVPSHVAVPASLLALSWYG